MTEMTTESGGRPAQFNNVRAFEDLPFSCKCGARWSGYTTAHCGAADCHKSFSGVSTFDRHRRDGRCLTPAKVGMSLVSGRPYACWGFPGETQTDTTEEN